MSETTPNPLEGLLSEFALGPAWARAKSEPSAKYAKHSGEREVQPRRRENRNDDKRGGEKRDDRNQRGRREFQKGAPRRPEFQEQVAPAEGVGVSIFAEKSAIQLICKEIHQVARAYPLFDIAQTILSERERCLAVLEISEKHEPFYQCKLEDAIFLTKEEALRHLLQSTWKEQFIAEEQIEVDPPKGNFQSVAKCGISGALLGPPNYHAYQTEIRRIHRERFPEMPFESFQAKIRTDRSEEAVNAWLDSMKLQTRWRILGKEPVALEAPKAEEIPEAQPQGEIDPDAEIVAEEANEPAPPSAPEYQWFTDRAEFERAIATEVLGKAFKQTRKAKVSAAIAGKNLSPGLLVRLKATGNHHRKHPAIIIPMICKALEAEHMPVFKRKGKLFTGPARPQALAADAVLAERPGQMVKWIRENPPAKLEGLWLAMLPEGSTAPPQGYAADLFWLLQQGHILLFTDDTLVVQELPKPPEPKKPKTPKAKKPEAKTDDQVEPTKEAEISALEAKPGVEELQTPEAKVIELTETPVDPEADPS